jgi:hypothetical protein
LPHKIKSEKSEKIDKDKSLKMVKFTNSQVGFAFFYTERHNSSYKVKDVKRYGIAPFFQNVFSLCTTEAGESIIFAYTLDIPI